MAQVAETLLHRWFEEVWNQSNEGAIDALLAPDAMVHGLTSPDGNEIRGPAGFKPFFHQFRRAFPDLRITLEDFLVDGDRIAARCLATATHTGPGVMSAPTNKPVRVTGMCIIRVKDGKIAEGWNKFDFLSLYQQLGMELR